MIAYPTARRIVLDQSFAWGDERVDLLAAPGRVLAEDLVTDRPQPPFDRVTMDGIALDHVAYAGGRRNFPLAGVVPAGSPPPTLTDPATCLEVMTGAVRPPGTTTIVRYEDLERTVRGVRLPEGIQDGKNIHRKGEDAPAGCVLAPAGTVVRPATVNLLAGCGYARPLVRRLPRTTVVATGDELVPVTATPAAHQIRRSNLYHIHALLAQLGIAPALAPLPDDKPRLLAAVGRLLAENDLLIFTGGVSKGKYDYLPEVFTELGVETLFHRVAQRPGKPLWAGRTDTTMVFGLPGNPVSAAACSVTYVLPFLRNNLGTAPVVHPRQLAAPVRFPKPLTLFQLVAIDPINQHLRPLAGAGSGDASSMLQADGFAVLPAERDEFGVGEWVEFLGC